MDAKRSMEGRFAKMPTLIGGCVALVALAAGILARVEPITIVQRAGLAFILGVFLTQLWYVFFTVRVQKLSPPKHRSEDEDAFASSAPTESKAA